MADSLKEMGLLEGQKAVREKCFHPSGTFVEFTKDEIEQSIPDRFKKIVALYPDRLAVKTRDRALTYRELNQAVNRIARAILEKRGPGSEPVALLFEHGIDVIAAIFGALEASKFYVALDPSFPPEKLSHILEDSGAQLIITNNCNLDLARKLTRESRTALNIDEINDSVVWEDLGLTVLADDIAHLIYTTGSTGEPKGVAHSHRTYLHRAMTFTKQLRVCPDDKFSLLHSVSFGSSRLHLFQSLLMGASLFPFDVKSEGIHRLAAWLKAERITICHLPPAVFRQLAELSVSQAAHTSLRLINLSGSPITQTDLDLYRKKYAPETALRIYMGTTETLEVCSYTVESDFCYPGEGVPAGYPVPGKQVLLLNEDGHEVGPNQEGEIAVKSRYLPSGYWNRPDQTKTKFLPDPRGGDERIYLTGDLGLMLPDGFLIHLGRKDSQVNIRGHRVELGEIERALLSFPRVKETTVVPWDREPGEKSLAAYIVPGPGLAPALDELRGFLKGKLPDYMIPSAFMFLESLPLINGKLDHKALPKPANKRPEMKQPYVAPRSQPERKLGQIWEEVLDVRPIGMHDDFFALGGHSLAATQVVSQIIKQFQLELPLQSLFQSPTVAEMATVIAEHQGKKLGREELERILTEIESISDEEAQRLLPHQGSSEDAKKQNE